MDHPCTGKKDHQTLSDDDVHFPLIRGNKSLLSGANLDKYSCRTNPFVLDVIIANKIDPLLEIVAKRKPDCVDIVVEGGR